MTRTEIAALTDERQEKTRLPHGLPDKTRRRRHAHLALLLLLGQPALADIRFSDVTQQAGIAKTGPTYGASWGDFNGDGWPDLWVGAHDTMPSLFLNGRNGSFQDIIGSVWQGNPRADKHGAAWADFDGDGDQDLIVAVAAEYEGERLLPGQGANLLYLNQGGRLEEVGKRFGVEARGQEARASLWLDADRDGLLDVLIAAHRNSGKDNASILFRQTPNGFEGFNKTAGLRDGALSRSDYLRGFLSNLLHLRFRAPTQISSHANHEFAQLADLDGDGALELIVHSQPSRVYSTQTLPFSDITNSLGFPNLSPVGDVVIEDFDGDQRLDMYLTLGPYRASDVRQPSPLELKATLLHPHDKHPPQGIQFRAQGDIEVTLYPSWLPLSKVAIGTSARHPEERTFILSPNDEGARKPVPATVLEQGVVAIEYDPETQLWTLRNGVKSEFVDVLVHSQEAMDKVKTLGFEPFVEKGVDALLMNRGKRFVRQTLSAEVGMPTACFSVTAGDFDNDMDMDLYLVCSGPVENLPNRLYENDGHGAFTLVPSAGGAAGSALGRGDVVAMADYDRDGYLDLFVTNGSDPASPFLKEGPYQLFHNQGNGNHWLEIDLQGKKSNHEGIGASVSIEAGGVVQSRGQAGGMHRFTQNHQRLHFGLARNDKVDRLTIRWPSGTVQHLENVAADQILTVSETE